MLFNFRCALVALGLCNEECTTWKNYQLDLISFSKSLGSVDKLKKKKHIISKTNRPESGCEHLTNFSMNEHAKPNI